jgi:hypothetical protein
MGLEVGGHHERPDWPKLGPSLLIATCLILAIRTAKWPPARTDMTSNPELDKEIDYAAYQADRVLSHLITHFECLFPQKKVPWYMPDDEDIPK